jgi:hypothetical protein
MKSLGYACIKLDIEIFFDSNIKIALLTAVIHPFLKDISEPCKDYVADVGAWHLPDLSDWGQAINNHFVCKSKCKDGL